MSLPPNTSFQYKMSPAPESWVNLPFLLGYRQTVELIRAVQTHPPPHSGAQKPTNNKPGAGFSFPEPPSLSPCPAAVLGVKTSLSHQKHLHPYHLWLSLGVPTASPLPPGLESPALCSPFPQQSWGFSPSLGLQE